LQNEKQSVLLSLAAVRETHQIPRNAEDGVLYGRSAIFCIGFICNLSNPQALCASSFAKGAHTIGCGFVSLLRKGGGTA
ncbi:MAG: hypothetical protein ACI4JM_07850, partial [Oscillospiraceae bacterium]